MSTSTQMLVVPELKDILFATDFSPCSVAVLPVLRSLALCCASTVHVVHVIAHEAGKSLPLELAPQLDAEYREADAAIQSLLASDAFRGITHTSTVQRGNVGEVLASLAEKKRVGLIVLGTHGRRGLKETGTRLDRRAGHSYSSLPGAYHWSAGLSRRKGAGEAGSIIVATDFDAGPPHLALRFAASLARANHTGLILLHAVAPNMDVPQATLRSIPFTPAFSVS